MVYRMIFNQTAYFGRGAIKEIPAVAKQHGFKKAFIVTDSFLFKRGFTKNITDKLDELGIQYACFYDVAPDPTLGCAMEGVKQIRDFEPDVIIALGGGSPMDAAKIMWEYSFDIGEAMRIMEQNTDE